MGNKIILTIARQYGSGGREIGVRVGELLGVKTYDKELIIMAAQKSGMSTEVLHSADEKATNSLLYSLALGSSAYASSALNLNIPINDRLFITQSEIIRDLAAEDSCVIVGRCGDYVLRNTENVVSLFIYAPLEDRVKRLMQRHAGLNEKEARDLAQRTDKRRISYYNYYTGRKWGAMDNYDMMIDSSMLGVEGTAAMIADILRRKAEL